MFNLLDRMYSRAARMAAFEFTSSQELVKMDGKVKTWSKHYMSRLQYYGTS